MPSVRLPKRDTLKNFTFNGEIRQGIPDFQKLNLDHEYYIDIGMKTPCQVYSTAWIQKEGEKHLNQEFYKHHR